MIFYFSGTGNSLYAAKALGDSAPLVDIAEALQSARFEYDLTGEQSVGFVIPVYFFGVPSIALEFLDKIQWKNFEHCHVYLLLTCGGMTAHAGHLFQKYFERDGRKLHAVFAVRMTDNFLPVFTVPPIEKQTEILRAADHKLNEIKTKIESRKKGDFNECKGPLPALVTFLAYPLYGIARKTKGFSVSNACTGCGFCEKICPSGAIQLKNGRPEWRKEKCVLCLACLNRCPAAAIERGRGTRGKTRFINRESGISSK